MSYLIILISLLLLLASVIIAYQIYSEPTDERINNAKRLGVWWLIFIVCSVTFYTGLVAIVLLLSILVLWLSIELSNLFAMRLRLYRFFLGTAMWLASVGFILWLPQQAIIFCFLTILFTVILCTKMLPSRYHAFLWWCYCSGGIAAIMVLAIWFHHQHISYLDGLMAVFFIAAINDITQYIVGSLWGRLAITPSLSPNKTLEGMVGGIVVSGVISGLLLPLLWGITWQWALCLGYSMALSGILGDLMVSLLKRRTGVKHSGSGLPGHGGILDRLDSMIMIAPVLAMILVMI